MEEIYLEEKGLSQLRIAETEKYAHVTFFFNGGVENVYEGEDRKLIPSPKVATYDMQPEMSAYQICDRVLKEIESETTIILSHGCYGEFCDSGEKIIFSINNEDFVADSVYSFVVKQNGITVMNREFTASEVMATVPEFTNSEYYINELEEKDMTEEILVPVDFDETLVLLSMYENSSVGESKSIIDIEGLVIKTRERGWFEHALKDSNGNTFDKAKFCVNKNIPNSFPDALKLSFKKYMIGAEESLQFIGVIPSMIIGPIAFPFLLIGFIVTFPFQII